MSRWRSAGPATLALGAGLALGVALSGLGCGRPPQAEPRNDVAESGSAVAAPTWRADLDAWVESREAGLRQPDSWLSLAGLYWLADGESTVGSDPSNAVVFPEGAPGRIGVFTVAEGSVRLRVEPGVAVTHDGARVSELELLTDTSGDPTMAELGTLLFYAIDRGGRLGIRLKDRESPLLRSFAGIDRYPADQAWRVTARLERYDPPRTIIIPNVLGQALPEPCPGRLVFTLDGEERSLEPTGEPGLGLDLVFGDLTNGDGTYHGGRFLDADWPGPDGTVVLDFNRAYNPPCVFTPWATCPLPPPQNRLDVAVRAGEKMYRAPGSHTEAGGGR